MPINAIVGAETVAVVAAAYMSGDGRTLEVFGPVQETVTAADLPTTDPEQKGQLWNNAGSIVISSGIVPALTAVNPNTKAQTTQGAWTVTATGKCDSDRATLVIVDISGANEWASLDITDYDGTTFVAHYLDAPTSVAAAGVGHVELRQDGQVIGNVPFTWT